MRIPMFRYVQYVVYMMCKLVVKHVIKKKDEQHNRLPDPCLQYLIMSCLDSANARPPSYHVISELAML